ncbi:MAG TPA: motility-associated protein, partial [Ignavibacteriaceae bacterium]|nr:motility-associated protein [Ignavibacteriaceae bacterium]
MFVIVGLALVVISIVVGFTMAGGNLLLLLQWSELLVIGGAAVGSVLIATPLSVLKKIVKEITQVIKPKHNSKQDYLDLLKSFNELFLVAQRDGLLSIEKHI